MTLPPGAVWDRRLVGDLQAEWDGPLEIHRSIDSTNRRALDWCRDGAAAWSTVIANEQTSGRGRRGRRWESRADLGLWMSVIVPVPLNRAAALTLHVGLVAARAVESVAQAALNTERVDTSPIAESTALGMTRPRLGIKWPNDLEIDGKKIGGVLCEAAGSDAVIAGIGVNVSHDRGDFGSLDRPAGSLKSEWGVEVSRAELAIAILSRLKAVPSFARLEGEILSDLRSRNALLGRTVEGRATGGDVVVGAAQGIDTDGALLVKAGHAVVRVISGPIELSGGQTCI